MERFWRMTLKRIHLVRFCLLTVGDLLRTPLNPGPGIHSIYIRHWWEKCAWSLLGQIWFQVSNIETCSRSRMVDFASFIDERKNRGWTFSFHKKIHCKNKKILHKYFIPLGLYGDPQHFKVYAQTYLLIKLWAMHCPSFHTWYFFWTKDCLVHFEVVECNLQLNDTCPFLQRITSIPHDHNTLPMHLDIVVGEQLYRIWLLEWKLRSDWSLWCWCHQGLLHPASFWGAHPL